MAQLFKNGTYRIFYIQHNSGTPIEQQVARILIKGGEFHILEDHEHLLSDLPEGQMSDHHQKVLWGLSRSGYYKIVHENETNEGLHDNLIDDLDIGEVDPDAEYIIDSHDGPPKRLQMFGETAILNGEKLGDEEVNNLMNDVRTGRVDKIPI